MAAVVAAMVGVALLAAGVDLVRQDPAVHVTALAGPAHGATVDVAEPLPAPHDPHPTPVPEPEPEHQSERQSEVDHAPEVATLPPPTRSSTPPAEVVFPATDVTARVTPVGVLASGALQLPDDPATVGWWSAGALPGEEHGTVVVAGHVDSGEQVGVLSLLPELVAGDVVTLVGEGDQQHSYAVVSRESVPKAALDPALFARGGPHRLALITCGGQFDARAGSYEDNVIVLAEPLAG